MLMRNVTYLYTCLSNIYMYDLVLKDTPFPTQNNFNQMLTVNHSPFRHYIYMYLFIYLFISC